MLLKISDIFLRKYQVECLNSVLSNKRKIDFFQPLKVGINLETLSKLKEKQFYNCFLVNFHEFPGERDVLFGV